MNPHINTSNNMTNNRSETNISPITVPFSGWLNKRSRWLRQWRRRYIKLSGHLMYFSLDEESKDSNHHHMVVDLSEYEIVRSADETTKKEFTFEIIGSFVPRYFFQASSITEMQEWMETIARIIDRYQPSSKVIKNVVGKTFIVLSDGKLYKIENYEHHHQYEISRHSMLSQQSNLPMSMSQSFNIPTPKYTPVDIPILTKQQRKCLLLPMYRNKPFEIKDSSKKKPLILVRGDNNEVIFLPAW